MSKLLESSFPRLPSDEATSEDTPFYNYNNYVMKFVPVINPGISPLQRDEKTQLYYYYFNFLCVFYKLKVNHFLLLLLCQDTQ